MGEQSSRQEARSCAVRTLKEGIKQQRGTAVHVHVQDWEGRENHHLQRVYALL